MRPRLSRSFSLLLFALTVLFALAYFPLSHIRAASTGATILPSAAKPLVNLKNPQTLKIRYTGDGASALNNGSATPVSLAAADFNSDGAIDVVAGYSTTHGGVLVLFRGNPDAFAPTDPTLYQKAMRGVVPSTFLSKAATFSLPESPDLLVTGDFNRDGHQDVLVASRGGNLYFLAGDGTGNFLAPTVIPVIGQVRALSADPSGHVAVSLETASSEELAIFAPGSEGLTALATYPLPARGDSMAWGNLGTGADVAVGAGSNIAIVYNAVSANAQTETVTVPFQVMGLTLGDFIWDRDSRTEIAALADDGSVQILRHGTLNTVPLTAADLPARAAAIRGKKTAAQKAALKAQTLNPTAPGPWTVAQKLPYTGSAPSGPVSHSAFASPHLAESSTNDVMVLDAASSKLSILDTSGKTASASAAVSFTGTPVAALALPQKIDSSRDVVVMTSAQSAPMTVTSNASLTLTVTTTADGDNGVCTSNSTTVPTPLTLREAVCIANNSAPETATINVPAGTYSLTDIDGGELVQGVTGEEGAVSYSLSIVGAGAGSTIIQQTDGKDRILTQDYELNGNNPISISSLTMQGGFCTDQTDDNALCGDGGGAILGGGEAGSDLTLTNVTMTDNQANPTGGVAGGGQDPGGAIYFEGPNLTITSSSFSSNVASGVGGAIGAEEGLTLSEQVIPGTWSITSSTFTNNSAGAVGGGIEWTLFDGTAGLGSPSTSSVSGSTFTGNTVTNSINPGGAMAIYTGPFTMSDSRIVGNVAPAGGNGAYFEEVTTATITDNWWGCNGGPGASGCDEIEIDGGTVTYNPWLVLSISAGSTQIDPNSSTGLTASITANSNGGTGFSVPNGTPVSFGATLGTISGASSTLTSGVATATFNSGSSSGTGSGTATVDNQEVSTTIDILVSVTVTTSPANLSITIDGLTATAPQTYDWVVGSAHTIATTSPQNISGGTEQVFSSWSDGGAISHAVTAPSSSTTYTASFTTEYQLTTQASPAGDGTVTPTSGQYFASGASIPVTATANTDFTFNNWTSTGGSFGSTASASTNFTMPAAATTVTANFIPATTQITITTSPANLLVSVDGGSFVAAPLVETWNQGSSHTIATESPQSGGTGVQYVFSNWSDGGAISHSITVPSTATTYTASFATQYQLSTQASPAGDGTVTPASGSYYAGGATIPVTATANAGFQFTNWTSTGGSFGSTTSASTNFTMPSAPATVTGNFTTVVTAAPTSTTVGSNNNPSFTTAPGNLVTFTATVTSTVTINEGTVTFSDSLNILTCSGGNTVAVSSGQAQCVTSFTTEGTDVITAIYNGTVNFQPSSGTVSQVVNNHTVVTGNQFCNQGPITVPSTAGAATPYPSNIFVSGYSTNLGAVTVQLNNISSSDIAQTDLLLVGPTGAAIVPFAAVGDGSTISGVNITLDDTASSLIPGGSPLTSGTYQPTSITGSTTLVFPSPAPALTAANYAATDGSATLTTTFQNTSPNGTWALYAMDNAGNGAATIGGGWCINITPATVPITITTSPAGLLVSVDGGTFTAAPLVENWTAGSTHTIATTSPQTGAGVQYVWSSWSDSGAISHTITVPSSATTYTATFNTQYQLTMVASPSADGSVTPASGSYYAGGATIPVTATANAGFQFTNWTSTGGSFGSATSASTNFTMPSAPATVTGNFAAASEQITITTSPAGLLVSVDGGTFTPAPLTETWTAGSSHTIATESPQGGGTGVQYVWSNWSDGGAISHTITVPSSATTYTATFSTQYQLTTQASPAGDGTVTPASGSYYAGGATIPVTATANAGFQFTNWTSTGGSFGSTTSPSTNFTMPSAPATVTGNFTSATQLSVTPTSFNFGTAYLYNLGETNVTVKNIGTSSVSITSVSLTLGSGTNEDDFTFLNRCPKTLPVGKSCVINVIFFAGNIGSLSATLNVNDNAAGSPQQVSLSATVINPQASFSPNRWNFGTVQIGHSSTENITLTNTGTTALDITSTGITGANQGDYSQSDACPGSLAPGSDCIISVTFTPTATGTRSANLTVIDNAEFSTQNVPLKGKGSN